MSTNIKFVQYIVSWLKEIEMQLEKYESSLCVMLNNFYENMSFLLPNDDHIKLLKDIESNHSELTLKTAKTVMYK